MHSQRAHTIVGNRRPRTLRRLLIASTAMVMSVQAVAPHVSAGPGRTNGCAAVTANLTRASAGLLMPSESDYPFGAFRWTDAARRRLTTARLLTLTGHAPGTAVEVVDLDVLFRNLAHRQPWHDPQQAADVRKFQRLVRALRQNLTDIRVYRVGTIRIDVYIVGTCGRDLAGLSTTLIET